MTTAKKRVVKKSASKKPSRPEPSLMAKRVVRDALQNPEANDELIEQGGETSGKPAKTIAKVVNLIVSVPDADRGRSFEDFVSDIKNNIGAVEPPMTDKKGNRKPGPHVALTGGYYILDGKVCLPEDYDAKKEAFKKGATPPVWAGGPKRGSVAISSQQRQMDFDQANLSSDEYDKKYKIGKYRPKPDMSKIITPEMQKKALEDMRAEKLRKEEEELEEFDWDEDDVNDDVKLGKIADKSAFAAAKKLKGKKRVVKRPTKPEPKKVVRRVKK